MTINLYLGTLQVENGKGICTITAYNKEQAKEIAEEYWQGFKNVKGEIKIQQISGITCECNVSTSLKILCGNTLDEILAMHPKEEEKIEDNYQIGNYMFDVMRQTLTHSDGTVDTLTTKESDLLSALCCSPNKLIDRDLLLEKVWGESNYYNSRSMDVYIFKLRKHFNKDTRIELLSVHGKGFKFIIPEN